MCERVFLRRGRGAHGRLLFTWRLSAAPADPASVRDFEPYAAFCHVNHAGQYETFVAVLLRFFKSVCLYFLVVFLIKKNIIFFYNTPSPAGGKNVVGHIIAHYEVNVKAV